MATMNKQQVTLSPELQQLRALIKYDIDTAVTNSEARLRKEFTGAISASEERLRKEFTGAINDLRQEFTGAIKASEERIIEAVAQQFEEVGVQIDDLQKDVKELKRIASLTTKRLNLQVGKVDDHEMRLRLLEHVA